MGGAQLGAVGELQDPPQGVVADEDGEQGSASAAVLGQGGGPFGHQYQGVGAALGGGAGELVGQRVAPQAVGGLGWSSRNSRRSRRLEFGGEDRPGDGVQPPVEAPGVLDGLGAVEAPAVAGVGFGRRRGRGRRASPGGGGGTGRHGRSMAHRVTATWSATSASWIRAESTRQDPLHVGLGDPARPTTPPPPPAGDGACAPTAAPAHTPPGAPDDDGPATTPGVRAPWPAHTLRASHSPATATSRAATRWRSSPKATNAASSSASASAGEIDVPGPVDHGVQLGDDRSQQFHERPQAIERTDVRILPRGCGKDVEEERRRSQEVIAVERVAPLAADLLDAHQPGRFEALEVPGRRRPGVAEAIGELACGHRSTPGVQGHEDVSPVLVGEGPEDRFEVVELP